MLRLSRRRLLCAAAAAALPLAARAQAAVEPLRIGAVLPLAGSAMPDGRRNLREVGEAARMGLLLGEEDAMRNGALLGRSVVLALANAPEAEAAARAARRLIARDRVSVLVGGFTREEAEALAGIAQEEGRLFLNIAATSDALRRACRPNTFHIEASAAMYLDAIFGWFVRAGYRRWFFVHDDSAEGEERLAHARARLDDRHWGAERAGEAALRQDDTRDFEPALGRIREAAPDVVLLLTDWRSQLDFLARYEAAGLAPPVTGFPEAAAQTREFYLASRMVAPVAGSGHRSALWEATLDAYGARELNARFAGRWGRPMDPSAWAGYQAVKIAFESALGSGSSEGTALAAHIAGERGLFDVSKGIGVTFRPWDHQLRQSLYLAKINADASASLGLAAMQARASLVGELPAIYMPGTDPVDRLDQLGLIDPARRCT